MEDFSKGLYVLRVGDYNTEVLRQFPYAHLFTKLDLFSINRSLMLKKRNSQSNGCIFMNSLIKVHIWTTTSLFFGWKQKIIEVSVSVRWFSRCAFLHPQPSIVLEWIAQSVDGDHLELLGRVLANSINHKNIFKNYMICLSKHLAYAIKLQSAIVPLLPDETCKAPYVYGPERIKDGMICAGFLEG